MLEFWYASYVFLGLSLAIGIAIYLIYKEVKKKEERRKRESPLVELERKYLSEEHPEDEPEEK